MHTRHAPVTAVASGKGGVGKTNLSVNLAVALARAGERAMLVDCDMGLANAGILLGLDARWTLADLLARHCELADIVQRGPGGVALVPGHSGTGIGSVLPEGERRRLMEALRTEAGDFDHIIIDTGGGIGAEALGLLATADRILVVLAPEPTSFMDAYALVKALAVGHGARQFGVVTNMVQNDSEGRVLFDRFNAVIARFLEVQLTHVGSIPDDPYVREAVFRKRCCVEVFPGSRAGKAFTRLARRIAEQDLPALHGDTRPLAREEFHGAH